MGKIQIVRDFPSRAEKTERTLRIYLPDAYAHHKRQRFPVLYMQDGQNIYDHPESAIEETWGANQVMDELIAREEVEPWIIVGVDHRGVKRLSDYGPWDDPEHEVPGHARRYARFVREELKPWVDAHFRTLPDPATTAVAGSSMGGLISLYLGWKHANIFGRIGAFSPTVMWGEGELFRQWKRRVRLPLRIYIDAGAREKYRTSKGNLFNYGMAVRDFHRHLQAMGYTEEELMLVLEPEGHHHERDWRRRLPAALSWLLHGRRGEEPRAD